MLPVLITKEILTIIAIYINSNICYILLIIFRLLFPNIIEYIWPIF